MHGLILVSGGVWVRWFLMSSVAFSLADALEAIHWQPARSRSGAACGQRTGILGRYHPVSGTPRAVVT
eukprot:5873212-Amphidinium_carterae.1